MLKEGTIRPFQSPYAYPVVLTRKNNGIPPDSPEAFSGSDSTLIRGLRSAFLSLIRTQAAPGSLQFECRSTSWSPYHFLSIAEGTSEGLPQKSNRLLAGGASPRCPQIPNLPLGRSRSTFYRSLSNHVPPNHPSVISCSLAAPVGLGSLDLFFFCRSCRSQLP
ncbi:hypothetical protein TNCV_4196261 [Trichonephila clavipes]|nr:hypothetical protein TNCV_4196261 [Trichonephila clavipes]